MKSFVLLLRLSFAIIVMGIIAFIFFREPIQRTISNFSGLSSTSNEQRASEEVQSPPRNRLRELLEKREQENANADQIFGFYDESTGTFKRPLFDPNSEDSEDRWNQLKESQNNQKEEGYRPKELDAIKPRQTFEYVEPRQTFEYVEPRQTFEYVEPEENSGLTFREAIEREELRKALEEAREVSKLPRAAFIDHAPFLSSLKVATPVPGRPYLFFNPIDNSMFIFDRVFPEGDTVIVTPNGKDKFRIEF